MENKDNKLPSVIISLFVLLAIFLAIILAILFFEFRSGAIGGKTLADAKAFVLTPEQVASVQADTSRSSGPIDAPITIVEFSDFECPYCGASFPILKEVLAEYSDKIRFIYRDFNATDVHENAALAGTASRCAAEQDAFLKYHDKLFLNQSALDIDSLVIYALQLGLECLISEKYDAAIEQDTRLALQLGFIGTPTWVVNEFQLQGVVPEDVWIQIIENILSQN